MSLENFEKGILVESTLDKLTHAPVTPSEIKAIQPLMRDGLVEAGVNLNLSENGLKSLSRHQFRSLNSGRGPGIVEALGPDKAEKLLQWCHDQGNTLIGGRPDTEGRGLQQLTADLLKLMSHPHPSDEDVSRFTLRLNQRIKKDTERRQFKGGDSVKSMYKSVPKLEDRFPNERRWEKFASVPYDSVPKLWKFLISP